MTQPEKQLKHLTIYNSICNNILKGVYRPGQKLPTENELAERFQASRPTVGRAMRDLQQKGLIVRRQGQGTFVKQAAGTGNNTFGLLVQWQVHPDSAYTMTTIFGVMVPEMLRVANESGYSLLLNDIPDEIQINHIERAKTICQRLVDAQVAGVFFTPLEIEGNASINYEITETLNQAGISVVLLDRDITDSYHRSDFDIIGINNEQSALVLTHHLVDLGCRKIDFIAGPVFTTAINDRIRGYRAALEEHGIKVGNKRLHCFDSKTLLYDQSSNPIMNKLLSQIEKNEVEAFVCVNDSTAVDVINFLLRNGVRVPEDVRVVGFDDLPISRILPVSLTTVRQPTGTLAYEAIRTLIDRIKNPDLPARDIMVKTELVIRESCGSKMKQNLDE
jgi:GntR family transcriptional regulator of arabinose operon